MKNAAALIGGVVFGLGLTVSGMADPAKVLAFLTLSAAWDPSLLFVMASALVVTGLTLRRSAPLAAEAFMVPQTSRIDGRLCLGAALFGAGWGLAGYCPGPALVGGFLLDARALAFLSTFAAGVIAYEAIDSRMALRSALTADG